MNDVLRVDALQAHFRSGAAVDQPILATLPVGHLVTATGAASDGWQPCSTNANGKPLAGFVSATLLRAPINPEVDRLVEIAGAELQDFGFGKRKETDTASRARIKIYWQSFGTYAPPADEEPWSAAFISFVVKRAALPKSFKFAGRHTTYLSDSKLAALAHDASFAYWAVPLATAALRVGDLVAAYRTGVNCGYGARTYDSLPGDFCSHCDVVVAIRKGVAHVVGGNVAQSVASKDIRLDAGGKLPAGQQRIALMARNF